MPPRRKGPRYLIIGGAIAAVIGVLMFVGGFVMLGSNFFGMAKEAADPEGSLQVSVDIPGLTTVDLSPGRYQVVALGPTLVAVSGRSGDAGGHHLERLPFPDPDVTVTAPDGVDVRLEQPSINRLSSLPGHDMVGFAEFTAAQAGQYRLEVRGEPGQVVKVGIDEAESLTEEAAPWLASSVVIVIGGLLTTAGVIAAVGGLVWRVVSGASAQRG